MFTMYRPQVRPAWLGALVVAVIVLGAVASAPDSAPESDSPDLTISAPGSPPDPSEIVAPTLADFEAHPVSTPGGLTALEEAKIAAARVAIEAAERAGTRMVTIDAPQPRVDWDAALAEKAARRQTQIPVAPEVLPGGAR